MAKSDAKKAMKTSILSGYRHHSYGMVRQRLVQFLTGQEVVEALGYKDFFMYEDVLGPTRIRSVKNGMICLITVICRQSIELGVDVERSFSLSDYYINVVEEKKTERQLELLLAEILESYADLVKTERYRAYSLPVTRAIRYISQHLYQPCRVKDIAVQVRLNAQYFSELFKKEVGISPAAYIRKQKMEEAANLLTQSEASVGEIAEILGYCNASYFIHEFKREYDITPKNF